MDSIPAKSEFDSIFLYASKIVETARATAYHQINETLVKRNWELGKIIAEEDLKGEERAKYGATVISELALRLTEAFGKGFTKRDLYHYLSFYKFYPSLFVVSEQKVYSVSTQFTPLLSWTHYRTLLQELNDDAREWYEKEAALQNWSVRVASEWSIATL